MDSPLYPECAFFSSECDLGSNGVEKIHPVGKLSPAEKAGLEKMLPELAGQVKKGRAFVNGA